MYIATCWQQLGCSVDRDDQADKISVDKKHVERNL